MSTTKIDTNATESTKSATDKETHVMNPNDSTAQNTSNDVSPVAPPPAPPAPPPVGPPPSAVIPDPPPGFVQIKGGFARGVRPRSTELIAVSDAAAELRSFADWQATLGKAAPDPIAMATGLDTAGQWSVMRGGTRKWYLYCSNEEGLAWLGVRAQMAIAKPLLQAAVKADPSLLTKYPKLCALFGARSSIANKGASTRAANTKAVAHGEPATHGTAGKKRQRAAEKQALAEKVAAATASKPATTPAGGSGNGGGSHA